MMTIIIFEWTTTWNKFVLYIYTSNPKLSEDNLIELLGGLLQLNRKVPLCLFLCISSWSSVKTLLRCSFLYFLATFTSPRCLHSLFYTSLSCFKPGCVSSPADLGLLLFSLQAELCILHLHPPRSTDLTCSLSFTTISPFLSCPAWSFSPTPRSIRSSNEKQTPLSCLLCFCQSETCLLKRELSTVFVSWVEICHY